MGITHTFVSTVADDPQSVAAGEVVPSNWNDAHIVSGVFNNENLFTEATVSTVDATVTTIATIAIPVSTTLMIDVRVVARRTGGLAGSTEDGGAYIVAAAYKNVAGVATEIGEGSLFSAEDQAGWAVTVTPSGSNALIQVTGAADNNISWKVSYKTFTVSS